MANRVFKTPSAANMGAVVDTAKQAETDAAQALKTAFMNGNDRARTAGEKER